VRSPCRVSIRIAQSHSSRSESGGSNIEFSTLKLGGKLVLLGTAALVDALLLRPALEEFGVG
jgi:hypothetical protein